MVDGFVSEKIQETLAHIPTTPGVYMMKNDAGEVIYVGKAINLRNRVRSYFQQGRYVSAKVKALVSHVVDIEYIVTDSEIEALILESNLIKEKEPWYNVRLKDDKAYPYLKITDEPFPRVIVVRRMKKDGGRYFGPYTNVGAMRQTLKFLQKLFPIRTCSLDLSGELDFRPCLLYHIGRCGAPCAGLETADQYQQHIDEVALFLEGRQERLIPQMRRKMEKASADLEFERAARLRDQLFALEKVVERQKVVSSSGLDQDVIGLARDQDIACIQIFFVRSGKIVGREHFFLDTQEGTEDAEITTAFVQQYYSEAPMIPKEVLLQAEVESADVIGAWLGEKRGNKVRLHVPQRGSKKRLVEMVQHNAELVLQERAARLSQREAEAEQGMAELQEALGLDSVPYRIEAYDISNIQGHQAVASMVVLEGGEPKNSDYRRFKMQSEDGKPDDFKMMAEVIRRRFVRGLHEREDLAKLPPEARTEAAAKARFAVFPDLVLIDGGKGQLGAARETMRAVGVADLPTIGLAKKMEEVFREGMSEPIILPMGSPGLHLLQRVRDEAHRFAITYHRQLRDKRTSRSVLDGIEGVGPKRKKLLIRHFGSVKRMREASLDELRQVPGLPQAVADRIYERLPR